MRIPPFLVPEMFGVFFSCKIMVPFLPPLVGTVELFQYPENFWWGDLIFLFEIMGSPFALLRNFPIGELGNTNHQTFLTSKKQK